MIQSHSNSFTTLLWKKAGTMLKCFRPSLKKQEEPSLSFLENGSSLLEELIASFSGRYKNPIRCLTAKELTTATNNFDERFFLRSCETMFLGSIEERPILVKKFSDQDTGTHTSNGAIRDIVVSSQMSHHKNVLKLRGCCLEFRFPALVYEYAGTQLLSDLLRSLDNEKLLSWRSRLHIAKGIADAIAYLHEGFPTAIIHRNLVPSKVFIDKDGSPKLFDFSLSIPLPPGKSEVADVVMGTWGFVDPEYLESSIVTKKTDVYSFGVLLLLLLTGKEVVLKHDGGKKIDIVDYVKIHVEKDQLNRVLDPKMLVNREVRLEQELKLMFTLALECTQEKGNERPDMIHVAKELSNIERRICNGPLLDSFGNNHCWQ